MRIKAGRRIKKDKRTKFDIAIDVTKAQARKEIIEDIIQFLEDLKLSESFTLDQKIELKIQELKQKYG